MSTAQPQPMSAQDVTDSVGTISWTEIPVLSIPRSAAFYKAIFSWETTSLPGATEECTDNTTQDGGATAADPGHAFSGGRPPMVIFFKGKTHGAFVQCPEQHLLTASTDRENINRTTVAVTVTITVEDIDETLAAVVKNGGKVWMSKAELPKDMGYIAKFEDTEGNIMGLWAMHDKSKSG